MQLQRNILGNSALQNPRVSEQVVGYLTAALDAIAAVPPSVDDGAELR